MVYVVGRTAGEFKDRTVTGGDYLLSDVERANLEKLGAAFENVVVVLNSGGIMDTKFFGEIEGLDSLLLMSQAGCESGTALERVLSGAVTPSGKLTDTWAVDYEDYPSSETFAKNDGDSLQENYTEGIYNGYRYFDTFGVTPAYEFGYGLSYTDFTIDVNTVYADADKVTVNATVTNTGDTYAGKEVVEVYFSAPDGTLEKPYQELADYEKTDLLAPGESQQLTVSFNTTDMSSYDEELAAYVMDAGDYVIRVGNSSRNTEVGAVVRLDKTVTTEQLSNQLVCDQEFEELSKAGAVPYTYEGEADEIAAAPVIELAADSIETVNNASPYDDQSVTTYLLEGDDSYEPSSYTFNDGTTYEENIEYVSPVDADKLNLISVYNGETSLDQLVASMNVSELAKLVNGIGMGGSQAVVGAQANTVNGAAGETTGDFFYKYFIPNIVLSDGPAGIRITKEYEQNGTKYYQYATAFPIGTLLAQTWDKDLINEVGQAVGEEMVEFGVTIWLAPGMNIHRNPLCGRNFEYYSEDPVVSGITATNVIGGLQSVDSGITVTTKHYMGNNQESDRQTSNSSIGERTSREIYLKGFEIAIKNAKPKSLMTSYNRVNGISAAANYDLCTDILRGEWGFDGFITTDWYTNADPAQSMHAGNDVIMPGGHAADVLNAQPVIAQPSFTADGYVTYQLLYGFLKKEDWNDFVLKKGGASTVSTTVAAGVTLSSDVQKKVTAGTATVTENEDGSKTVTYIGNWKEKNPTIALGDLQKSAKALLSFIMESPQFRAVLADPPIDPDAPIKSNYTAIVEGFDWGPAITKLVVDLGVKADAGSIDKDTFGVYVERTGGGIWGESKGDRAVTSAYLSDKNGAAVDGSSRYVTIEMPVGPTLTLGSPFNYNFFGGGHNEWVDSAYTVTQLKDFAAGDKTISDLVIDKSAGQKNLIADEFEKGSVSYTDEKYGDITLNYGSWSPAEDEKKNPLIIWLHGAGEGGTDPDVVHLGNKVVNLATDDIQQYFDGAYVLTPQAPTMWMDDGSGGYNTDGSTMYEGALMNLIEEYVAANDDIDMNRIYIGGCSNGGFMTMKMIIAHPDYFAAAYPICEALPDQYISDQDIENLKDLPIWITQAANDTTVKPSETAIPTYNRLIEAGASNVHFSYFKDVVDTSGKYTNADGTPYQYMGHWSWIYTLNNECTLDYDGTPVLLNGEETTIMEWLAAQNKAQATSNTAGIEINRSYNVVTGVSTGTEPADLLSSFSVPAGSEISIVDAQGNALNDGAYVGTGCQVIVTADGVTTDVLAIAVSGDVNGDGRSSVIDLLSMKGRILGRDAYSAAQDFAADVNGDSRINIFDLVMLKLAILNDTVI
ncbi:glycoside hydrolase family 3 N-terminal domain-containing protein [Candidatus Soleaferrea massiliensis]|uniref:glycoside hydrolase family 3 N-terminal domain-containing protein n=1 Tax=Candidatus Soleaferrea massiliensis TaxID=1470354 RepID=UPI0024185E27|nr:glycoside hydrolase family 3 N-terminal domain-containing protein [Candidatus Soleaferrea massiliensis]